MFCFVLFMKFFKKYEREPHSCLELDGELLNLDTMNLSLRGHGEAMAYEQWAVPE